MNTYTFTKYTGEQLTHKIVTDDSKIRVICMTTTGSLWQVNEKLTLSDMEDNLRVFFRHTHGKRETYTVHRGQLIVRNTVQFTGASAQRKTTVYLVVTHEVHRGNWRRTPNFGVFCLGSHYSGIESAKRAIDRVLDQGYDDA